MARGLDKHNERRDAVGFLGKELARRARSKCEFCEEPGALLPLDTAPEDEPTLETLALACERCRSVAGGAAADARTLRFLEGAVWHAVPAVSETARRLIREVDADWARDTVDLLG
ncbi:MAG: protein PhnA [Myxococcota bacterium]|jgi:protein PhnA